MGARSTVPFIAILLLGAALWVAETTLNAGELDRHANRLAARLEVLDRVHGFRTA